MQDSNVPYRVDRMTTCLTDCENWSHFALI